MDSLKVGDVVCLKSDAIKRICPMTVSNTYSDGEVECIWFNTGSNSFSKYEFVEDVLFKI